MIGKRTTLLASILGCTLLVACGATQKKADVLDLYELPRGMRGNAPMDNDGYYTQPTGIRGCTSLNEGPSCGGG